MNPCKLDIDDMTAARITIGHGPKGWIMDMGALGHGSTRLFDEPPTIGQMTTLVTDFVAGYMDKMQTIIADKTQE